MSFSFSTRGKLGEVVVAVTEGAIVCYGNEDCSWDMDAEAAGLETRRTLWDSRT